MTRSFLLCITLSVLTAACSKTSAPADPTAPTEPTPPAATRIIRVGGNMNFGDVPFDAVPPDGVVTVSNDGNEVLQLNGIAPQFTGSTPPAGTSPANLRAWCFEVLRNLSPTAVAVAPGQTLSVGFHFAPVPDFPRFIFPRSPTDRFDCSGTLTVTGNQTSGTSTIAMTAIAVP